MKFLSLFFILMMINSADAKLNYEEFAFNSFRKYNNTLTIHIIPATYKLEWTKPRWLLFSLLKNEYWFPKTKSTLGHVTAEINCQIDNKKIHHFIGQTSPDLDGFKTYVHMGYGFSILNSPNMHADLPLLTTVGNLNDYKKLTTRFEKLIAKDNMGFLSLKIDENACKNIYEFMLDYEKVTKETKLAGNRYGFGADPSKFEGAGCAPMVRTIFEKAGLSKYARHMEKTVYVKEELLGDPPQGKKVGVLDLLLSNDDISMQSEGKRKFIFPDPQGLYDLLHELVKGKTQNHDPILEKKNLNEKNVWYLLLDASNS